MLVDDKALVVAMELLRQRLGDTNVVLAAVNTRRTDDDFARQAQQAKDFSDGKPADHSRFEAPSGGPDLRDPNPQKRRREEERRRAAEAAEAAPQAPPGREPAEAAPQAPAGREPVPVVVTAPLPLPTAGQSGAAAPPRPPPRGGGRGGRGGPPAASLSVLGQGAPKVAAVAGPAAILGQVLESNVSGFRLVATGTKLLASVFAPVLLPATMMAAAGMAAVAEALSEEGGPALEEFFDLVFEYGIPALEAFVQSVEDAVYILKQMKDLDDRATQWVRDQLGLGGGGGEGGGDAVREALSGLTEGDHGARRTDSALSDVMRSLRNSLGPRGTVGSVEGVSRQAQAAALNADPLEQRLMRQQLDALQRIERSLNRNRSRRAFDPRGGATGAGDFSGGADAGGGGDYGGDF